MTRASQTSKDYLAVANRYIKDVLAGTVPACKFVKQCCQRQIDDLKRFAKSGVFYFDEDKARRVCQFIELLQHTKGALARQRIRLEPWQIFILTTVFGWRWKSDGTRRFRKVYIEVPRGNGKSCLSSGVALYCLLADGELGAEVYSFATTRDQARIVFNDASQMVKQDSGLCKHFGITVGDKALSVPKTNSTFKPQSSKDSTLDGLNTHFACIDELHAHRTRAVFDVVETSLGKRLNPLLWVITTAGTQLDGICYEVRGYILKVLSGMESDDSQFGIIYTIDDDDDWATEAAQIKANPNWGVSVNPVTMRDKLKAALVTASSQANYKTKHLNVWCNAGSPWMDMVAWEKCKDLSLSLADFENQPAVMGLDLAAKNDIVARMLIFPCRRDGRDKYAVFGRYYLPEAAVLAAKSAQYQGWVDEGHIVQTDGAMTDLNLVEEDIRSELSQFELSAIAYDPWQATQMAVALSNDGAPMVEYRNTVANLSDPMKTLEALVLDGRIVHNGDPVLTWMMSNVVAKVDAKDNIFPRKERKENKIDGVVALIFGLAMILSNQEAEGNFDDFASNMIVS